MLLFLACATAPLIDTAGPSERDSAADSDPDSADTGPEATDTSDSAPTPFACPPDMVGVPTDNPAWCMDPYEVSVVDGQATSVAGAVPTVGLTYEEAAAICAVTPAVEAAGTA